MAAEELAPTKKRVRSLRGGAKVRKKGCTLKEVAGRKTHKGERGPFQE